MSGNQNTFEGNQFGQSNIASGMHPLHEEETDPAASPTASSFQQRGMKSPKASISVEGSFANYQGFSPASKDPVQSQFNTSQPPTSGSSESQGLPSNYNMNRRTSVSAESLNPASPMMNNWTPPHHAKSSEQESRLRSAVANNFLFSHLDEEQSKQVLGALQEKPIPAAGIKVIQQGDVGDYFYVIENGLFDFYVNPSGKLEPGPDGLGNKVGQAGPGGSFGELALMYNAPRAATAVSVEPSTLWALDRITFRRILMDSAFQRRRMYESFLDSVPLLQSLTPYERSKIADALESRKYPPGSEIIRQGDPGDNFYILETGEAEVFKRGENDAKPVRRYKKGDYFGELALLNDAPRAASVISSTDVKVATLGKDGFQRLLGPVEGIMRRNDPSKVPVEKTEDSDVKR